jgi:heme-degrading monooxygenase HmoA
MIKHISKEPYYAVIFTSVLNKNAENYDEMAIKIEDLAKQQKGFLGIESARNKTNDQEGITVSYWESLEAILNWKNNEDHAIAISKGKEIWYKKYTVRICKVEREYEFEK